MQFNKNCANGIELNGVFINEKWNMYMKSLFAKRVKSIHHQNWDLYWNV